MHPTSFLLALATASLVDGYALSAYPKLQAVYNKYRQSGSACTKIAADGFKDDDKSDVYRYCFDFNDDVLFLHRKGGLLNDMDIDCDGTSSGTGGCSDDQTGQTQTAFGWKVPQLGGSISELDAQIHPYVVFGNTGANPSFDPEAAWGLSGLSVMAVVCNNQVHYGVWADTNYGTSTGEASLALAKLCFPNEGLSGNAGHDANDVLYIAFARGEDAVPSTSNPYVQANANWGTTSTTTFENSIKALGDRLVQDFIPQV